MIIILPVLVLIIGLLMYVLSGKDKVKRVGEIMFFCGLLVFLLDSGEQVISLMSR